MSAKIKLQFRMYLLPMCGLHVCVYDGLCNLTAVQVFPRLHPYDRLYARRLFSRKATDYENVSGLCFRCLAMFISPRTRVRYISQCVQCGGSAGIHAASPSRVPYRGPESMTQLRQALSHVIRLPWLFINARASFGWWVYINRMSGPRFFGSDNRTSRSEWHFIRTNLHSGTPFCGSSEEEAHGLLSGRSGFQWTSSKSQFTKPEAEVTKNIFTSI